jgi:Tfp pilus assembly protein PilN
MVRRINLVPASERRRTETDVGMLVLIVIAVVVVAAVVGSYVFLSGERTARQEELNRLQAEIRQIQTELAGLAGFERLQAEKDALEKTVQQAYVSRTLVSEILGDLSLVIPETAWLGSLSLESPPAVVVGAQAPDPESKTVPLGTFTVEGNTYSFEEVAGVLVRFETIPALVEVTLGNAGDPRGSVDPNVEVRGFTISAGVKNAQPDDTPLPVSRVEVSP